MNMKTKIEHRNTPGDPIPSIENIVSYRRKRDGKPTMVAKLESACVPHTPLKERRLQCSNILRIIERKAGELSLTYTTQINP